MILGRRGLVGVAAVAALVTTASACGDSGSATDDGVVDVVASFYPLQFVAQRVGGVYVKVSNLTPPGAEPHDLELAATDLARMSRSDLVVYLKDFAPAVDDAVRTAGGDHAFDVTAQAHLDRSLTENGNRSDPHFWLDPLRLADVADAVADRLAVERPDAADAFRANAASLRADLVALDGAWRSALADCRSRDLVTSHLAFGYLAAAYDLRQVGITGVSPDEEPTPAALAEVARFVKANGVTTVYTETLVSPDTARTVAAETGATVAVLDPLEGLAKGVGGDYLSVMRTNLATLVEGQGC